MSITTECLTPGYHEPGSKWHLAPNFSTTTLADEDSIEYAINLILTVKNKRLAQAEKQKLIRDVEKAAKGTTVRDLKHLQEHEYNTMEIPLLCKIYLRHLLKQCFTYHSKQELLAHDFNFGVAIDWNEASLVNTIAAVRQMGFSYDECCEAAIVTNNASVDAAVHYALLDGAQQTNAYNTAKRARKREKLVRLTDDDYAEYMAYFNHSKMQQIEQDRLHKQWTRKLQQTNLNPQIALSHKNESIIAQIDAYKQMALRLRSERERMQRIKEDIQVTSYEYFVRGLLAGKRLNAEQMLQWNGYRKRHAITQQQHSLVLHRCGYADEQALEALKTYVSGGVDDQEDDDDGEEEGGTNAMKASHITTSDKQHECVVCCTTIASPHCEEGDAAFMLLPCNHVCLCAQCAQEHYAPPYTQQQCPFCQQPISEIKKVYFS